jgi:transcriptional regulator with XRE-family HTH domain
LYETTNLRRLRLRHGITLSELARTARVSFQQISRVELLQCPVASELQREYEAALEKVIVQRYDAVKSLERDYRAIKGRLLKETED